MQCRRLIPFVFFALTTSLIAQSIPQAGLEKNIKFTGRAIYGFAVYSDYHIVGDGLTLSQGSWDGPSFIGICTIGADCKLSFMLPEIGGGPCMNSSAGSLGNVAADFLNQDLTFRTTGVLTSDGGSKAQVNLNFSGTITGYREDWKDEECMLGPALFRLRISGHGTASVGARPVSATEVLLQGIEISFSGVAHVEDIP
jgi:hypothetical protein